MVMGMVGVSQVSWSWSRDSEMSTASFCFRGFREDGTDRMPQAVQDVRAERTLTFEKIAEVKDGDTGIGGDVVQRAMAVMNRTAQVARQRLFRRSLFHAAVAFHQIGKFLFNLATDFRQPSFQLSRNFAI